MKDNKEIEEILTAIKEDPYKIEHVDELKAFKKTTNSESDIKQLKEFGDKWKALGYVPIKEIKINDEFLSLINTKFKELGLSKKALASEQYKNKVNSLKGNDKALSNEKQLLRRKIDNLKKDIAQYENNISFFGKNKGTKALKKQVELQISEVNSDIEILKQKLQILNKG
ncbi:MAG: hypothetical protein P8L91_06660 [Candidatus Marinimicrobia bacterium]|nr:hypothetical protein [Candidatus Neomarinimicrobiota bacterium]